MRAHELELRAKQAEYLLVETEKQYKRIVETISEIVFQLDSENKIPFINSSSRSLGFGPEELIGKPLSTIVEIDDEQLQMIGTRRVGNRATSNLSVRFKLKKDSPLWSEMGSLTGSIDSYGLWNVSEELVSIPNMEK
ncbi:MAG: PAS domain-containing protein [Nitrospinae bacterium]|nr:PAS domain-containing protein [Nitrospinota bacterium]